MGQVQGLIPGMKREEDVPDPAPPAEGEYQEYAEDPNQYQEEQYTEWIVDGAGGEWFSSFPIYRKTELVTSLRMSKIHLWWYRNSLLA